jgi:hypothetical protein
MKLVNPPAAISSNPPKKRRPGSSGTAVGGAIVARGASPPGMHGTHTLPSLQEVASKLAQTSKVT